MKGRSAAGAGERVLVIGATQGTGSHIVRRLLRDGYEVRVLARNQAKARARFADTVEIVVGDVTKPGTLPAAIAGVDRLIPTVGVTRRPAPERVVRSVEYDGTLYTLEAAQSAGLRGRFMYMSAVGTVRGSLLSFGLTRIKGNTPRWRRRAEDEIRGGGLDYTIVHSGTRSNASAGRRRIEISQTGYRMSTRYRISREDVAEVFVQALRHPHTRNTTFDAVWAPGEATRDWEALFARLLPDCRAGVTR